MTMPLTNFQWGFIALNFKKGKYYLGKEMKLKYFILCFKTNGILQKIN